jgi:glutathionylspermidine synthase
MQRLAVEPCPDWRDRAEATGFRFLGPDGQPCWREDAAYSFTAPDIDILGDTAQRLEDMCLELVERLVSAGDYAAFGLSELACSLIEDSWHRQDKNLFGRIDLTWNGHGAPQLLGYAADAPAALHEASVVQWEWLDSYCNHCDQFNGIHEMLIEAWKHFGLWGHRVHFACGREHEADRSASDYLRDTAMQAGLDTGFLHIDELGWNGKRFTDQSAKPITVLCKLYPWEQLLQAAIAPSIRPSGMRMIEPAWKMLLSHEAMLPLLRQAFPDHENLSPAGVTATLPDFEGFTPVLGIWIVASRACGLGIRESHNGDAGRFVPHMFE